MLLRPRGSAAAADYAPRRQGKSKDAEWRGVWVGMWGNVVGVSLWGYMFATLCSENFVRHCRGREGGRPSSGGQLCIM